MGPKKIGTGTCVHLSGLWDIGTLGTLYISDIWTVEGLGLFAGSEGLLGHTLKRVEADENRSSQESSPQESSTDENRAHENREVTVFMLDSTPVCSFEA